MTSFHVMRPEWLWSLLPAILLLCFLWRNRGRSGGWNSVIAPELLPFLVGPQSGARSPNLLPFILLGWILAGFAASGPSWQKIPQPVHQKQDALVLVLDLSYSMKSEDLAPSRLERARQKLLDLLARRKEGQTGLIAYAGDAHIVTPLTDDTPTIANLLPALDPRMMPVPGSDPVAAVAQAVELLHSAGIRDGKVLLVTDGIRARDRKGIEQALARSGAGFAILGVGTATGAPIPLPDGGFMKDREGAIVMPSLDETSLRKLASETGGRYMPMQIDNSDLDELLAESALPGREPTLALDRTADDWEDQGYLFILPLLPLALALFRRGWVLCLLPLLLTQPQPARADAWSELWWTPDQQGQRALEQGDTETAAQLFEDPAWAGTAAYRSGEYESAVENFSQADDANAWYNRGNALARAGELDKAIAAYEESLSRAPNQADASENLALLEKLKQEQEEQEQQQQQQQGQDQDQQQDQQSDQQENQDQQQGGQQGQDQQDQQENQGKDQQPAGGENEQQDPSQEPTGNGEQEGQEEQERNDSKAQQEQHETDQQDQEQSTEQQAAGQASAEDRERDQAMEQWLRRVPDDPSGLLREKFRYESYQRQQQGAGKDDETYW